MLKVRSTAKAFGTPVRCPACRHPNLGIDIRCQRCGRPLDWQRVAGDTAATTSLAAPTPPVLAAPPLPVLAPEPPDPPYPPLTESRLLCRNCGAANAVDGRYCSRCGSPVGEPRERRAAIPGPARFNLPRPRLPRLTIPALGLGRPTLPRLPRAAWIVAAILGILLIAPLAYILFPTGRTPAARPSASALSATSGATVPPNSAEAAAIPGVEAKTGLRFSTNCKPNVGCLSIVSQIAGQEAAAVVFSTANQGRQCAGYVYHSAGAWHLLNTVCAVPGQLNPLVGRDATVHVPGNCANLRAAANASGRVVACLYDGSTVHIVGGPTYADGRIWWRDPRGWIAHDFLVAA